MNAGCEASPLGEVNPRAKSLTRLRKRLALLAAVVPLALSLAVGVDGVCVAQPPDAPDTPPRAPGDEPPAVRDDGAEEPGRPGAGGGSGGPIQSSEQLQRALARRLEMLKRDQAAIEEAIAQLREGQRPADVMRRLPNVRRLMERRDGEPGAGRPQRGPGGPGGPGGGGPMGPGAGRNGEPGRGMPGRGGPGLDSLPPHAIEPFFEIDALVRNPRDAELPPLDRDLTDDERANVDEFLASAMPALKQQLTQLREKDAAAASERYRGLFTKLGRAMELKRDDPETYTLALEALRLKRQINEHARAIANAKAGGGAVDTNEHRQSLEKAIDRGLTIAEQVRDRLRARRSKERSDVIKRIADWAIQRERMEQAERRARDENDEHPEPRPE